MPTHETSGEGSLAKRATFIAAIFAVCLGSAAYFFKPPTFVECKKGELEPHCVCPADERYIGKRNIIFVDITDKIPEGKIEDLYQLIKETAFVEQSFWSWITGGKKIEKTSIYLLSDQKPAEMTPVASYCSFPPNATWLFTDLSATQEKKVKDAAIGDVKKAVDDILQRGDAGRSHIVEALATVTSNATYWKAGSKLVILSDLYENSDTCGFFESGHIPAFDETSLACKKWTDILGKNLLGYSKNTKQKERSNVAICQILSKPQKEGVVAFWRALFQSQEHSILFTCDPSEIADRSK